MLSTFVSLAVAAAALSQAVEDPALVSHAFGKTYTSRLDSKAVAQTPAWDAAEENPPVSARQALKLADKMLRSIAKAPDGWKWKATNLTLFVGADPGVWYAMFQAVPVDLKAGPIENHEITLMVLMDGTVIKPVVAD